MKLITPNLDNFKSTDKVELECLHCHLVFQKEKREVQKVLKHQKINGYRKDWLRFCSLSCRSKDYQSHKTIGNNRSKLEYWLEKQLLVLYPNIEIKYNERDTINAELDIFIPSLLLAFELNGIFHYEPIFGKEELKRRQSNDQRKFQACLENNIELCIIDVSKTSGKFNPKKNKKYLDIITEIISKKLVSHTDNDPRFSH